MKQLVFILGLIFMCSLKNNAQQLNIDKNNVLTIYGQSLQLNPAIEKLYLTLECKLESKYSPEEIELIQKKLTIDFSGAKVVQSIPDGKIIFITNKKAIGNYQGIHEYIKAILVANNLYLELNPITTDIIKLK